VFEIMQRRKARDLELEALTALHAYPALYCRSHPGIAGGPAATLDKIFREELLARLSRELPTAVDKYTPDGRLPAA